MVHLEDEGVVFLLLPRCGAHHRREALGDLETWTKRPSDLRCTKRGVTQPGWGPHYVSPVPNPSQPCCSQPSLLHHSIWHKATEAHGEPWCHRVQGSSGEQNRKAAISACPTESSSPPRPCTTARYPGSSGPSKLRSGSVSPAAAGRAGGEPGGAGESTVPAAPIPAPGFSDT